MNVLGRTGQITDTKTLSPQFMPYRSRLYHSTARVKMVICRITCHNRTAYQLSLHFDAPVLDLVISIGWRPSINHVHT